MSSVHVFLQVGEMNSSPFFTVDESLSNEPQDMYSSFRSEDLSSDVISCSNETQSLNSPSSTDDEHEEVEEEHYSDRSVDIEG